MRTGPRSLPVRRVGAGAFCLLLALTACGGRSADDDAGGGTAGDPTAGITADEVLVGNVSALSGPIPGLFQGAPNGVEAYFAKINDEGGVHGRELTLISKDDALNCNQNTTATRELADQVVAFINNYSVFDGCGAKVLAEHPDIADVSAGIDNAVGDLPGQFSAVPQPPGARTGAYTYYKEEFGVSTVGTLYGAGSAEQAWREQRAALESVGYTVGYERGPTPTETNFTSDILRMREAGVDYLYLNAMPVSVIVQVLQQAKQQNWRPTVISSGVLYDAKFFDLLGDPAAAEGVYFDQSSAMFLGEDRDTNPAVDEFLTWMEKAHPETAPDLFALQGWLAAEVFVKALDAAGEDPTRQTLLDELGKIGDFDGGGLVAEGNVSEEKPAECWMLGQVQDGEFVRLMPDDEGFTCEPGGYFTVDG